ncbi:MAG: thiamine diphosphokinase [Pseudomonadota bacterium]
MTKNIIILLGGEANAQSWLLDVAKDAYVIAADGGIRHAALLNVEPDLWVGDFDSCDADDKERYKDVPISEYPSDKAKSDGEIAIEAALALKPQKLVMVGALGGHRTDHSFFNVLSALRFARENPDTALVLTGIDQLAMPILPGKPLKITGAPNTTLSIIPFSDLSGLTIKGVQWPLELVNVESGSTHTLSNIIVSEAMIHLLDGHAIAILQTNG